MLDIHPVCLRFFPCLPPTPHLFEVKKTDTVQKTDRVFYTIRFALFRYFLMKDRRKLFLFA